MKLMLVFLAVVVGLALWAAVGLPLVHALTRRLAPRQLPGWLQFFLGGPVLWLFELKRRFGS